MLSDKSVFPYSFMVKWRHNTRDGLITDINLLLVHSIHELRLVHSIRDLLLVHSIRDLILVHSIRELLLVHSIRDLLLVHSIRDLLLAHFRFCRDPFSPQPRLRSVLFPARSPPYSDAV